MLQSNHARQGQIDIVAPKQRVTADNISEIANSPEYANCIMELSEGEVIIKPLHSGQHGEILAALSGEIGNFVKMNRLGRCFAHVGCVLERRQDGRDTVRGADFGFVGIQRAPKPLGPTLYEGAPEFVVEVLEPRDRGSDMRKKLRQFQRAGCIHFLEIYPERREIDVQTAKGIRVYRAGDTITCPDILPGFELAVSDIFYD